MGLQRGDTLVCAFTQGREGNCISLSPEGKIVVLERASVGKIDLRSPYVCTIKAVGKPGTDGTPRSYVAHIDHALLLRDYDVIVDADFERRVLVLGLKFPTKFTSLLRREVPATVEETYVPARGSDAEHVTLALRHGTLSRSIELSRDEALRRGLRFNHFVRVPPPERPLQPVARHPCPRPAPAGWTPTVLDHTAYLLRPTAQLAEAIPRALESATSAELAQLARRRVLEVAALGAYDALPPESPDHVAMEQALTALARLACVAIPAARVAVGVAESRLALRRARSLPTEQVIGLLNLANRNLHGEPDGTATCELQAYLQSSNRRTSGAWALCNLDIRAGRLRLNGDQLRCLLADEVQAIAQVAAPVVHGDLVMPLREAVSEALAEQANARAPCPTGLNLEALPPCVAHSLKAALKRTLFEGEALNAGGLLCRMGLPSRVVNHALHGASEATPGELRTAGGRHSRTEGLQTPTCRINREIGVCAWTCPGVRSPSEYYARHRGAS